MASVSQFAQHLLRLDPQRNSARLTMFNYFKHVVDSNAPFTPGIVQAFYSRVLQFDQWQNDAQSLSDTARADIVSFLRSHAQEDELELWRYLRHPDTLQVVPIKIYQDLEELAVSEHEPRQKSGDKVRCVKVSEAQTLVLILSPTGTLEAKVFPNLAMVSGPRLRLVAPVTHLYYTSTLELMPHVRQILEGSLLTSHCFEVTADGVQGLVTRGATFQKFETFIRAKLSETQDLFLSLKKVERHFINSQSDPFYQELVGRLERANRIVNSAQSGNVEEAERALNRGRSALRTIFPNDRLLSLLVTHLEYGLETRQKGHSERSAPE